MKTMSKIQFEDNRHYAQDRKSSLVMQRGLVLSAGFPALTNWLNDHSRVVNIVRVIVVTLYPLLSIYSVTILSLLSPIWDPYTEKRKRRVNQDRNIMKYNRNVDMEPPEVLLQPFTCILLSPVEEKPSLLVYIKVSCDIVFRYTNFFPSETFHQKPPKSITKYIPALSYQYICIATGGFLAGCLCLLFNACSSSREDSALVSFNIREFKQGRRNSNNGARKQSSDWLGEET